MAKRKGSAGRRRAPKRGGRKSTKRTARRAALAGASCILVGVVVDKSTRLPVNNALVKIVGGTSNFGRQTHTNAFGFYLLSNLVAERDLIEASKGTKVQEKDKIVTSISVLNFAI